MRCFSRWQLYGELGRTGYSAAGPRKTPSPSKELRVGPLCPSCLQSGRPWFIFDEAPTRRLWRQLQLDLVAARGLRSCRNIYVYPFRFPTFGTYPPGALILPPVVYSQVVSGCSLLTSTRIDDNRPQTYVGGGPGCCVRCRELVYWR